GQPTPRRSIPFPYTTLFRSTPKGRLSKLEKDLLGLPWQTVREGVEVKLLPQEQEFYVLAQSRARIHKERSMRRRKLKWLWLRLQDRKSTRLNSSHLVISYAV